MVDRACGVVEGARNRTHSENLMATEPSEFPATDRGARSRLEAPASEPTQMPVVAARNGGHDDQGAGPREHPEPRAAPGVLLGCGCSVELATCAWWSLTPREEVDLSEDRVLQADGHGYGFVGGYTHGVRQVARASS